MIHVHQFFKISDETKKDNSPIPQEIRWGVKVICADCGEIRILWTDGKIQKL
jgi:hypothetical protein